MNDFRAIHVLLKQSHLMISSSVNPSILHWNFEYISFFFSQIDNKEKTLFTSNRYTLICSDQSLLTSYQHNLILSQ